MISFLRERLQGIVAFSFLGIVALTFAFLGLPTFAQSFTNNDYAKIGNYGISQSEYFRTRSQIEQNIRDQFGQQIDLNPLSSFIEEQAKTSLIEKYSIIKFFDELNIKIPTNYIETELSRNEAFQIDGAFDQEAFKNYLINFNLSKEQLIRDYSSDLKLNLSVALLDSLVNVFDSTLEQYLDLLTEKRTIKFVSLDTSNVLIDYQPENQQLLEYYDSNSNEFLVPEKISFNVIDLDKEALEISVSETELKNAYDLYLQNIPDGEKRVSHAMIIRGNYEDEESFNEKVLLAEDALGKQSFEDVVQNFSDDEGTLEENGDLGFTDGEVFPEEFESVIAALSKGDISEKIFYEGNVHFLKITDVSGVEIEEFSEKSDELLREIKDIKFEDAILNIQRSITGSNISLEQLEEQFKTTATLFQELPRGESGYDSENENLIFDTNINSWSDPVNISNDSFQLVQPVVKTDESIEDFELVKEEIIAILVQRAKLKILEDAYASSNLITLDTESLLQQFPIENFKIEEFKDINRTTSLLSNDIVNIVFNQAETGVIKKELVNNTLFIYSILERNSGENDSVGEEDRASIISQSRSSQLQYIFNALRAEYGLDNKYSENELIVNQTS
ncbi:MAG: SurA N-terminal domain-containing protein [Gammaproteobacteria bacterium]|nr:SurA N-terminal domain-containing protein [SAR86 cluster bacterium]